MTTSSPLTGPDSVPAGASSARPTVTELRLSAFRKHRGATYPVAPLTLFAGPSGSGKSSVLQAYEALARLGAGDELDEAFPDPAACVPESAGPDAQGRRGFRIGCTVDGPVGPVRLDLAVQAEPELRIVGERLSCGRQTLLTTALRDPGRATVQAAWHTAGSVSVTRAPLPDDRLGTALLPLRVAGKTDGQLRVLAAAEQVVVALRSVFACDPQPYGMRRPVAAGEGRLRRGCDNLAEVLHRTRSECARRHARLAAAARTGCAGDVADLAVEELGDGTVRALLGRGEGRDATPVGRLGEGELRYLGLALVLLTGPGVLAMDQAAEVPSAYQSLTVLADGFDRCLDPRQARELALLAAEMTARGHVRLVGAVADAGFARGVEGVTVVDLVP
ncbi:ATP-binding protein [Streptomyces sp. MS2.AVA.5]|uniref:ATP-binding protein n=1 Tax=Streptomyces achmelvichensis TaxID=3134111 RepID=A0ACC6Q348_9ACTN